MRPSPLTALAWLALAMLAGCNRPEDADHAAPAGAREAAPVPTDAAPAPAADTPAAVTMRYACGGHRIDVIGNDHARVTMTDGRVLSLAHVADSSPPLFAGEALEFSIDGDGARLTQDEGASSPCSAE